MLKAILLMIKSFIVLVAEDEEGYNSPTISYSIETET